MTNNATEILGSETLYAYPGREYETRPFSMGMTLRDYFAADAPISLEDAQNDMYGQEGVTWEQVLTRLAQMRFAYADAMLCAREISGDK